MSAEAFSEAFDRLQKSPRRLEVLLKLLSGQPDREIAESLGGIHEGTVRKQISLICETFGLQESHGHSKRADLVALFAKYKPELVLNSQPLTAPVPAKKSINLREAPAPVVFYGRQQELETLKKWIIGDRCRLVSVLGIGGIGKTTLAVKLANTEKIQDEFEYIIWFSLWESPPIERVLEDAIKALSNQEATGLAVLPVEGKMTLLMHYLRSARCLLILDNFEAVLQNKADAGNPYRVLLKRIGESCHESCLVMTSREKPEEVVQQEGEDFPVRTLLLHGLEVPDARKILEGRLSGSSDELNQLVELYSGNPLALKIAATFIKDLFNGEIAKFISGSQGVATFGAIESLLEEQFERLEKFEQTLVYWLAINREKTAVAQLLMDIVPKPVLSDLLEGLENLHQRSLIEVIDGSFTLQIVVMEYAINRLVKNIIQKIKEGEFELFSTFPLLKATAKDYIRECQYQLILKPVADSLIDLNNPTKLLLESLENLRQDKFKRLGYAPGNIINLFCSMDFDLSDLDFSDMPVWQAYLKGQKLHNVNFTNSDFTNSVFTQTFGTVLAVAFGPEETLWATGDMNNEIRLWKGMTQQIRSCKGHINWIRSIAFSPDGKTLASGSDDQTIKLWDIETGQCLHTLREHKERVWSVAFAIDATLASASADQTIKLWDIKTGQCLRTLEGHSHWVRSVAFSPDGKTLASGSDDQTIKLWDIKTGQCLRTVEGHSHWVRSVAFTPDGKTLASACEDRTIHFWDAKTGQRLSTLEGHTGKIWSIAFSPKGDTLISSGDDKTVKFWNVSNSKCLKTLEGYTNWAWSVAFSPDGKTLASSSEDKTLRFWNIIDGVCLKTLQGHTNRIRAVAFSPISPPLIKGVGGILASGSDDKTVRLWDAETGQCLAVFTGHSDRVLTVAFNADGTTLASAGDDRMIKLWKVKTGQCLHTLIGHASWIWSVAFSPNGQELASGSEDKTVRLWDVETGQCLYTLEGHTSWVRTVAFSPNGKTLASAGEDRTIRLWDVRNGRYLNTLVGHTGWIRSIAFSPDGATLASAGEGGTVRLWQVNTGQCFKVLRDHTQRIWSVTFAPNGKTLASGSEDGTIRLWDLESGEGLELRAPRLYEGMNITGVRGVTEVEIGNLMTLGARKCD